MAQKNAKRVITLVLSLVLALSVIPANVLAAIPNWAENNVVYDGTTFGTDGYYNVISKKDYVLVPGAAVESEMVINSADGKRRQVLHIIEVDPSNPDVSIVPGYHNIDELAEDPDDESNWAHQELTEMAKYYEDNLGYNIVGGMNTDLYYSTYSPRVLVYNGKSIGNFGENVATGGAVLNPTSSILYVFQDAEGNISCDVKAFNKAEFDGYLADGSLLHAVGVSFGMVVNDGELVNKTVKRGNDDAARSMVGVKEDGTLVICMNDGRGANNSVGLSTYEEGEVMLALGCQWAANCDGGGSSTFLSKRAGEETFTMRSVPCDGAQRPTAHGIFVASNVAPTGILDVINVESDYDYFAPNTVYNFGAEAIDTHGYAMDMPADAAWTLSDDSFGTLVNGKFVSNGKKGEVDIQITSGGKIVGSKTITVADPAVFALSATSTTVPYSTAEKVRTITLPIVAMIGEANVYIDTNAVKVALSNADAGILDGFNFTATTDTSIAGVDV
ncbi:MAG: phosphodiester glycosidase family protein, partial [Clostridia bacterium]|nr:phosphodiester glycosidase family protein [Clostridia bacterium]